MVSDGTRWPHINKSALHAFIHNCTDLGARVGELKPLLADIRGGRVADPDNELLGILLFELYPRNLPPSELWEYSFDTSRDSFLGTYWGFFKHGIHEKSSDDQVAALLDGLMARPPDVREALFRNLRLRELPAKLLARGLQSHGDQLAKVRLYGWLGAGIAESLVPVGDEDDIQKMRSWPGAAARGPEGPLPGRLGPVSRIRRIPSSRSQRPASMVRCKPTRRLWPLVPGAGGFHGG